MMTLFAISIVAQFTFSSGPAVDALDPGIARQIHDLARAETCAVRCAMQDAVLDAVEGDTARLVAQLLYYHAEFEGAVQAATVPVLEACAVPVGVAAAVAAQHLDHPDPDVRVRAGDILVHFEDRSPSRPPDFGHYRAIIESGARRGDEPAVALVQFMYTSDPGSALRALVRGMQTRDARLL